MLHEKLQETRFNAILVVGEMSLFTAYYSLEGACQKFQYGGNSNGDSCVVFFED